ncbi:hypothetical protein [Nonlabens sp. Hel1_33_55]|uniref:hypothetical protein n=1 Tax=Nonlabens sp. Hel1_33_55 TaxID=1336802 RepID=UPI000B87B019|nr:hypothetical protein [Nonlabens sp. Hel1_33_55]
MELENLYFTSIEIELFGVDTMLELDELIDMEIETWADLDKPISELRVLAQKAINAYIWTREDPDRLQEYICRLKSIHFLTELDFILKNLKVLFNENLL